MSSKAEIEGAFNYRYRQRLHYLGIPLTVNYSVFDRGRFDIYFSGGAMAEFALSARGTTELYKDRAFVSSETRKMRPTVLCGRSIWVWASVSIWWIISVFMWNRRSAIISRTSASLHPIGRKILGTSIWAWDSAINSDVSPRFASPDATFCPGCASYIVNSVL